MPKGLCCRVFVQLPHCARSQFATAFGSNRTQVPILKDGMRFVLASLYTTILETARMAASCVAVMARPNRSIRSAKLRAWPAGAVGGTVDPSRFGMAFIQFLWSLTALVVPYRFRLSFVTLLRFHCPYREEGGYGPGDRHGFGFSPPIPRSDL